MPSTPLDVEALDLAQQGMGIDDPQLQSLQATEDADPEAEAQLKEGLAIFHDYLGSEEGMAAIAQVFNQDQRPLYESVPDAGAAVVQKVHGDLQATYGEVDPAVFFGEGGLLQQVPPYLFEIAAAQGKPGADDPDQQTAALIGMYKKAGEYILDKGDKEAVAEAVRLGQDTLLTQEDGSMATPEAFQKEALGKAKTALPDQVNTNLLGI